MRLVGEALERIEVEVAVGVSRGRVDLFPHVQVFRGRRQPAVDRRDGRQLRGREEDVGALAEPVGEVSR